MNHKPVHSTPERHKRGFALVAGLVLLAVMSVLGVTMMNITRLENLMVGGSREAAIAFQASEAALRDAESTIAADLDTALCDLTIAPTTGAAGTYGEFAVEPDYLTHAWTTGSDFLTYASNDYPEMPSGKQPRYLIKHVGDQCVDTNASTWRRCLDPACPVPQCQAMSVFRITGWGTSRDATSTSLLQTHFACFRP